MSVHIRKFAIKPDLVMDLFNPGMGIRKTGAWTVYRDGVPFSGKHRTLNGAKAIVRDLAPDGTKLAWKRNEYGEWTTEVHENA